MEYVLAFVIFFITALVSYTLGRVEEMPLGRDCCKSDCYVEPFCNNCVGKISLYPTELAIREEQSYSRGKHAERMDFYHQRDFRITPKDEKEMTVEEITKELGYEIKIIK